MTREIKFRAWDKYRGVMHYNFTTHDFCSDNSVSPFSHHTAIWMQFTGLHDKNGKEIYEGDIVGWVPKGSAGKVYFEGGRFRVEDFYMASFDEPSDAFGEGLGILEIIGNVYENQELLK